MLARSLVQINSSLSRKLLLQTHQQFESGIQMELYLDTTRTSQPIKLVNLVTMISIQLLLLLLLTIQKLMVRQLFEECCVLMKFEEDLLKSSL